MSKTGISKAGLQRDLLLRELPLIVAVPPRSGHMPDGSLRADLIVNQPGEQYRKSASNAAQIVSWILWQ